MQRSEELQRIVAHQAGELEELRKFQSPGQSSLPSSALCDRCVKMCNLFSLSESKALAAINKQSVCCTIMSPDPADKERANAWHFSFHLSVAQHPNIRCIMNNARHTFTAAKIFSYSTEDGAAVIKVTGLVAGEQMRGSCVRRYLCHGKSAIFSSRESWETAANIP